MRDNQRNEREAMSYVIEAEKSLLGSMMLDSSVVDEVEGIVQPHHFSQNGYRLVAESIYGLHKSYGGHLDVVSVAEDLEARGQLTAAGGPAGLAEILESIPHAGHAKYYAAIVKEAATFSQSSVQEPGGGPWGEWVTLSAEETADIRDKVRQLLEDAKDAEAKRARDGA